MLAAALAFLALAPMPTPTDDPPTRFITLDLFIDSGAKPLAVWQLEFTADNTKLVGVEGGEGVFAKPPYHDPAALAAEKSKVILAAFSTADPAALPTGKARIARLHLAVEGSGPHVFERGLNLRIAADHDGRPIPAAGISAAYADQPDEPANP